MARRARRTAQPGSINAESRRDTTKRGVKLDSLEEDVARRPTTARPIPADPEPARLRPALTAW
jgi:hypothetical protein